MRSPLCTEELTCFISIHIMYFKLHRELCLTCACTMECTVYHACFSDAVIVRGWSLSAEKGGVLGPLNWRFVKSWRRICMMQLLIDTCLHVILPHHGFNIFLGISAWSGSASASLLKETGEVCNQGKSPQSPSPGSLHSLWCHYDNFFKWSEIKAVFWSEICCINLIELCNHPLKRCRRWRSRAWTSKKLSRQIISSTLCDSCSGGVVLFCSKFQESKDRQMVPFVESCWILFWDAHKHFTCL